MAITAAQTVDVAQALSACLGDIDGLRVYEYVADKFYPDGVIIGQPDIDWADETSGWCAATWSFPLTLIVSRNNDKEAQKALGRLVSEIAKALFAAEPDGITTIEPQNARPTTVNVAGTDLPAYLINVRVRA